MIIPWKDFRGDFGVVIAHGIMSPISLLGSLFILFLDDL